jgi:hypothetical protein
VVSTESRDVVLRRYGSDSYAETLDAYEADLASMADAGWFPVAQSWGWDAVGSAGWLVSGSHWKPGDGILAVTYRRDPRITTTDRSG